MFSGLVTSACLPVIQASSDGNLAGVACVDITLSDLFSDVTYFKQGELSYAFVVDGQSRLLSHPMMPRPYGLQDETVFIHMPSLEADSDDVRLSMIRWVDNSHHYLGVGCRTNVVPALGQHWCKVLCVQDVKPFIRL